MPSGSPTSLNPRSAACCAETLADSAAVSPQPDITVAAIVVRDGRFLVVEERIGGRDVLNQPAGHLERGETLLQAVVRETLEETAWTLAPLSLLGAYLWQPPRASRPTMRFAFVGEVAGHDPSRDPGPPGPGRPLDVPRATRGADRAPAQPAGAALRRRLPRRPLRTARNRRRARSRHGGIGQRASSFPDPAPGGRPRQTAGGGALESASRWATLPQRPPRPHRRRHLRRRRLRRGRAAPAARGLGRARPLHEQLGRGRRLLHGGAGLPGRAPQLRGAAASRCTA